jgi:hypothetical protein
MSPIRLPIFKNVKIVKTTFTLNLKRFTIAAALLASAGLMSACQMTTPGMSGGPVGLPLGDGYTQTTATYQTAPVVHSQVAPIQAVVGQTHSNGVEQNITLRSLAKTPVENLINVKYFGAIGSPLSTAGGREKMSRTTYNAAQIQTMWINASADWSNVTRPQISNNSLGSFAYVTGQGNGNDVCIYAWQYKSGGGRYDLNITYCAPNASAAHVLNVVKGLSPTVKGFL